MYRDQTFGTKTSEIAKGTSRSDLNTTSLVRYRDYMARFNPNLGYNRFDEDEFLKKLRIIEDSSCTYGGLLLFGKRDVIEKYFPDFRIDLLEIPGNSYSDAQSRYTYRLDEQENLWEYYFECFARLKSKVDVTFKLSSEGFGEELSTGLTAIREALVNLLMHADYFSPAHSRIRIFSNTIEFFNPGGLPKSIKELKAKDLSMPRNPIISKLFRMVKLAENAGFGFDKMEPNWFDYNRSLPEYHLDFDSVATTFYLGSTTTTEQVTEQVQVLIQFMDERRYSTAALRKMVGIVHKPNFLYNYLQPSLALQLIAMTQPDRPNSPTQRYFLTKMGIDLKIRFSI